MCQICGIVLFVEYYTLQIFREYRCAFMIQMIQIAKTTIGQLQILKIIEFYIRIIIFIELAIIG